MALVHDDDLALLDLDVLDDETVGGCLYSRSILSMSYSAVTSHSRPSGPIRWYVTSGASSRKFMILSLDWVSSHQLPNSLHLIEVSNRKIPGRRPLAAVRVPMQKP